MTKGLLGNCALWGMEVETSIISYSRDSLKRAMTHSYVMIRGLLGSYALWVMEVELPQLRVSAMSHGLNAFYGLAPGGVVATGRTLLELLHSDDVHVLTSGVWVFVYDIYFHVCMYIYVYMYTYICVCMYLYIYLYIYAYIYISINTYLYLYMHVYLCVCTYL